MLSKRLGIPYLSTGHIFRILAREKTPLGRYVKEIMNAGYLIPDKQTLKIVSEYLNRAEYNHGYILDGFPRTLRQAQEFKNGIDKVVYLMVSDKEAMRRLNYRNGNGNSEREDETPEAIKKRIELFHKFTEPVLDFYRKKGKLVEINGEQSVDKVYADILAAIQKER